jgi:hypothetical protein
MAKCAQNMLYNELFMGKFFLHFFITLTLVITPTLLTPKAMAFGNINKLQSETGSRSIGESEVEYQFRIVNPNSEENNNSFNINRIIRSTIN